MDYYNLVQTKHTLKSLDFIFNRLIEYHAHAVYSDHSFTHLSLKGYLIGFLGGASHQLTTRLGELPSPSWKGVGSYELNKILDDLVHFSNLDESIDFSLLRTFFGQLKSVIDEAVNMINPVTDLPTRACLLCVVVYIDQIEEALKNIPGKDHRFNLESIKHPHPLECFLSDFPLPSKPASPTKPEVLKLGTNKFKLSNPDDICSNTENTKRFFHFVLVDIEISAMQACSYLILNNRQMPQKFRMDMAKQIYDEARHVVVMNEMLEAMGGKIGDYPYSQAVWERMTKSSELKYQLAIQQVIQEGNAILDNVNFIKTFERNNEIKKMNDFQFINEDEGVHAVTGANWLKELAQEDSQSISEVLKHASKITGIPIKGFFMVTSLSAKRL